MCCAARRKRQGLTGSERPDAPRVAGSFSNLPSLALQDYSSSCSLGALAYFFGATVSRSTTRPRLREGNRPRPCGFRRHRAFQRHDLVVGVDIDVTVLKTSTPTNLELTRLRIYASATSPALSAHLPCFLAGCLHTFLAFLAGCRYRLAGLLGSGIDRTFVLSTASLSADDASTTILLSTREIPLTRAISAARSFCR